MGIVVDIVAGRGIPIRIGVATAIPSPRPTVDGVEVGVVTVVTIPAAAVGETGETTMIRGMITTAPGGEAVDVEATRTEVDEDAPTAEAEEAGAEAGIAAVVGVPHFHLPPGDAAIAVAAGVGAGAGVGVGVGGVPPRIPIPLCPGVAADPPRIPPPMTAVAAAAAAVTGDERENSHEETRKKGKEKKTVEGFGEASGEDFLHGRGFMLSLCGSCVLYFRIHRKGTRAVIQICVFF